MYEKSEKSLIFLIPIFAFFVPLCTFFIPLKFYNFCLLILINLKNDENYTKKKIKNIKTLKYLFQILIIFFLKI